MAENILNELRKCFSFLGRDKITGKAALKIIEEIFEKRKNELNTPETNVLSGDVSGQSKQLVNFLLHLNDKKLINNHDFDYEKAVKNYLKNKIN